MGVLLACVAGVAEGQTPYRHIGMVEYYGLEKLSRSTFDSLLTVHPGDSIPVDTALYGPLLRPLQRVPGVQEVRFEPVCCENGAEILFVGVTEQGATAPVFAPRPVGRGRVAEELRALSDSYTTKMIEGIEAGQSGDDLSQGHSLLEYPPARAIQERVQRYTAAHVSELRTVLQTSREDESRAIAAWALGYAPDKRRVISDLVTAARDPYPEVRNNAIRALWAIGALAMRRPDLQLDFPAEPMLALLRSPVWTDRNKVGLVLMNLTQSRDSALLARLRADGLPPLVEMARWRTGHSLGPFMVVARVLGVSDSAAFAAFQRGDREAVLRHAGH